MKKIKSKSLKTSKEIAQALGITSPVDHALMVYKAELSSMAVRAIKYSELTVNEIVKKSGVARSKVSAIKNGALAGISSELFIRVISACGGKIILKVAS